MRSALSRDIPNSKSTFGHMPQNLFMTKSDYSICRRTYINAWQNHITAVAAELMYGKIRL